MSHVQPRFNFRNRFVAEAQGSPLFRLDDRQSDPPSARTRMRRAKDGAEAIGNQILDLAPPDRSGGFYLPV
jgi:hypothetical protein